VEAVCTESVTVVAALPEAMDDGLKVAVAPVGRPVAEKETAAGMVVPPIGATDRL